MPIKAKTPVMMALSLMALGRSLADSIVIFVGIPEHRRFEIQ
jgi:hypothetical protein